MDLKSQLWTPSLTAQTLSQGASSSPAPSLARSRLVCRPLPSPRPWGSCLNLASDSTDLPPNEDLASNPLGAPHPRPRAESRLPGPGASAPRPQGPAWQPGRAGGPSRARGDPTATPRACPQPPPGPSAPANAQPRRIVFKESWGSLWHITNCDHFCVNIFSCICGLCIYIYV